MRRFADDERELPAALDHAADGAAALTSRIEETHMAIARRVFVMAPSLPVQLLHDTIGRGVYSGVRLSLRAAIGAGALAVRAGGADPHLTRGRRGALAQAALNGVIGDRLARENSPLTVHMAVRRGGRDVALVPSELSGAFPHATDHPVLLVHGLCEQEAAWSVGSRRHGGTYRSRVIEPGGGTVVKLRYNTGLRLTDNGERLSELIELLVAGWPVPVRRLSLIGHSMGGLVSRSAIAHGRSAGREWTGRLHTLVTLGSPHAGAPAARAAGIAARACEQVPELRPLGAVLRTRSAGIADLETGDFRLPGTGRPTAGGRGAIHHAVAATVSARPRHPLGRVLGDLLVLPSSAHGRRGRRPVDGFDADGTHSLGRANHFTLLNTPRLDAALNRWLFAAPAALEAA